VTGAPPPPAAARPPADKSARHAREARLVSAVAAVVRRLPRRTALAAGRALAGVWADLDRRHVAVACDNLRRAFPRWDEARVQRTARGVYAHFGQVLMDLLWIEGRSRDEILRLVSFTGLEHAEAALARGRGALMVSAHLGNWELHALAHSLAFGPVCVVGRPLDNPLLDARLNALRTLGGSSVISKRKALQRILEGLRRNLMVAVLIDQNTQEKDGIFVDFFGRPACTTTVAAALAVKTGCALVPCHARLLDDGRYRLMLDPPLEWTPSGEREADIAALTQRLTTIIEGWVREAPEQWLWLHRRWKTQPGGARNGRG
jgi:KDO2-lipid IV(A) lauroyltransferase